MTNPEIIMFLEAHELFAEPREKAYGMGLALRFWSSSTKPITK
jgi:hypothetical protein